MSGRNLPSSIQAQAAALDLVVGRAEPRRRRDVAELGRKVNELEATLIPHGLHVVGEAPSVEERVDMLLSVAEASHGAQPARLAIEAIVGGAAAEAALATQASKPTTRTSCCCASWQRSTGCCARTTRSPAIVHALDGGFVRPAPGRRPAAHAGDPADRSQPAWLRPVPHPERLRRGRRRPPGGTAARAACRRRAWRCPSPSPSCCGAPTT